MNNAYQKDLENQKLKYKSLLDFANDGIHILDEEGNLVDYSPSFARMLGYEYEQMQGFTIANWDDNSNPQEYKEFLLHVEKSPFTCKTKQRKKDGTYIDVEISATIIYINDERFLYASSRDFTLEHQSKIELENQKIKYQSLLENSTEAIFVIDLNGNVIEANNRFCSLLGYTNIEALRLNVADFEALHDKTRIIENIQRTKFQQLNFETKYKRKDGEIIDVSLNIVRILLGDSEYIYCSFRDITEIIKQQKIILKQKKELEAIFKTTRDGIAIVDFDTRFLNANEAFLKLTGYDLEQLKTKTCYDITISEDKEKNQKAISDAIKDGYVENVEKRCKTKDGKIFSASMSVSLLPDEEKLLLTIKDMTTIKLLEQQSKLASMGEMIGNIAHQWRQPLSVITTSASGLKLHMDFDGKLEKEDVDKLTESIMNQANYLSKTIDNFREFIKGNAQYSDIGITYSVQSALDLVKDSLSNNFIKTVVDIQDDLHIIGNHNLLMQAFINILNNSKDALVENIENEEQRYIFITSKKLNDDTLEIIIQDTAGGIDNNIINRIFEPYFTTKHQSRGTGMGLSMVDKIIRENHLGTISVHNQEFEFHDALYKGACFKITFRK